MTVLHTVLHSTAFVWNDPRRDARQLWPKDTVIGAHDIVVAGRALSDLARERRTPCILIAPVAPSAAHPEADPHVTLVVARITAREEPPGWHREASATVDCDLRAIVPLVTHVERLRTPRARDLVQTVLRTDEDDTRLHARLPKALSPGDLIVFACTGALALSQVAPRTRTAAVAVVDAVAEDVEETGGVCRKYRGEPFAD
ncbi:MULTISPECIES: hypothetical protein [Microbacterium]|uniref:hypothetical protein n=1 Tax=Microbacterium TaxID=33882 RepID=UPI0004937E27|nr:MULTISPECIES: hypothetical protein [Microbacterium]MCV0335435.1 hypothetical protein [Microbacterium sp.]MCV0375973.1 hypothetical protein [Microbacterium sp.]MCV0390229.1 hypothetical protein [Microbacterium sp.]MCV0417964.1 hypothetical protein [Microbacterium sp.]MCV0422368.1 hypothetical protein [Microbacterium sp.]